MPELFASLRKSNVSRHPGDPQSRRKYLHSVLNRSSFLNKRLKTDPNYDISNKLSSKTVNSPAIKGGVDCF
jgi:hypothetical protein